MPGPAAAVSLARSPGEFLGFLHGSYMVHAARDSVRDELTYRTKTAWLKLL